MASFRILSLDGGGLLGAFSAGVLASLEKQTGRKIFEHFDLRIDRDRTGDGRVRRADPRFLSQGWSQDLPQDRSSRRLGSDTWQHLPSKVPARTIEEGSGHRRERS